MLTTPNPMDPDYYDYDSYIKYNLAKEKLRKPKYLPCPDEIHRRKQDFNYLKKQGFPLAFIGRIMQKDNPPIEKVVVLIEVDGLTVEEVMKLYGK